MKKETFISILFIFAISCAIFFKIFTKGLFPIPADLLVSFYFPYYSGGWEGYTPWTTRKELLGADSVRQIYLWKEFAANQLKEGKAPLWNPYTFSGQPLLSNFQSSVFYPLNIFYFLTSAQNAWILLIVIQPFLGGIFMYLLLKSLKIEKISALFGSTTFMFSSYLITWMENGNIAHSYIWLPLSIWSVNNFFDVKKYRYLIFLLLSLTLSVLGGHPQTAIYVFIATYLFWAFKIFSTGKSLKVNTLILFIVTLATLSICAIQLLPTAAFYKISPISLPFSTYAFDLGILPAKNLISFFASDFFGHPANNNFWSQSYGDFTPYFGVIPLVFSLWAIVNLWKNKFTKFATIVSIFFILSALNGPITFLIKTFKIPLLDATTPSRFISISIFFMAILASMGFSDMISNFGNKKYIKKFISFTMIVGIVYVLMWAFAALGTKFLDSTMVTAQNLAVTRRNLILPTLMFISVPAGIIFVQIASKLSSFNKFNLKSLYIAAIFSLTIIGGIYYTNKFLPFAPKNFIFPNHPIFTWLQQNAGIYRFYGGGTAHVDFNFPTHYQIYAAEGYDTLRIERYAQLLASGFDGGVPQNYLRSDAVFPNVENGFRKRLFDLLGVKYLLDKEDNPKNNADWHYERFSGDEVKGYWQEGKFQIYDRPTALPRIFQTTKYVVLPDKDIIEKIYDSNFDLKTLLLENKPNLKIDDNNSDINVPQVLVYEPGYVKVETDSKNNSLLFISDAHDPDWKVKIDNNPALLTRAHYAFLATEVPAGKHQVLFEYKPSSFKVGQITTLSALFLLSISVFYFYKKRVL